MLLDPDWNIEDSTLAKKHEHSILGEFCIYYYVYIKTFVPYKILLKSPSQFQNLVHGIDDASLSSILSDI